MRQATGLEPVSTALRAQAIRDTRREHHISPSRVRRPEENEGLLVPEGERLALRTSEELIESATSAHEIVTLEATRGDMESAAQILELLRANASSESLHDDERKPKSRMTLEKQTKTTCQHSVQKADTHPRHR